MSAGNPIFKCEGHPDCDARFDRLEDDVREDRRADQDRHKEISDTLSGIREDVATLKGKSSGSSGTLNLIIGALAALAALGSWLHR